MNNDNHEAYRHIVEQVAHDRRQWLSRRRLLQASSAAAVAAIAATYQPREVFADVKGTVTLYFAEGKRWGDTQRAVQPLFNKVYPNVEVRFAGQPIADFFQTVMARMSVKTPDFDVTYIDWGRFPGLHAVDAMISIEDFINQDAAWRDDYLADVPRPVSDLYRIPSGSGGQLHGLTSDGNAALTFYRKDVLDQKGIAVPATWDEAIEASKALHDPSNGVYGHISNFQRGAWAGTIFWGVHATCGGWWFDKMEPGGWNPAFATDAGYEALRIIEQLMKYAHPVSFNATEDEVNKAFASGAAAYGPLCWGTAVLNDPTFTDLHEVINFDLPPAGKSPGAARKAQMGGLGHMLNKHGANHDAAWAWMKFFNSGDFTDPAIGDAIVAAGGQPARNSTLSRHTDRNFLAGLAKVMPANPVGYLMQIPEANAIQALMGEEAADFVNGQKDIDAALKSMDDRVRRLMEDGGYYG
ncbi:MAG: extracellular solute-binding protein [Alphaproteobacteria bacterium]|nr:extracellular solute-binding protein [Alphaproteobacteria bacterium]